MRALVPGLASPYPLGTMLPAVLQEDPMAMRLTEALDEVLAPVISSLDCLAAYLDPQLAPVDFLEWLAGWVGLELDEHWAVPRQRAAVASAIELHRMRGTVAGLRALVAVVTGAEVEVVDGGGVSWSTTPGQTPPGAPDPVLVVRVTVAEADALAAATVDSLVASAKPAHVRHRTEIHTG